jgi:hypothetical protein
MILECRNSSNTAQNILRTGKCAINFLEDGPKDFASIVKLGFPGETSKEKMAKCKFELEPGQAEGVRPLVVKKAFQVFECTWDDSLENAFEDRSKVGQLEGMEGPYRNFNGVTSKFGCHFILKIDKILMKEKYYDAIINGGADVSGSIARAQGLIEGFRRGSRPYRIGKTCIKKSIPVFDRT